MRVYFYFHYFYCKVSKFSFFSFGRRSSTPSLVFPFEFDLKAQLFLRATKLI